VREKNRIEALLSWVGFTPPFARMPFLTKQDIPKLISASNSQEITQFFLDATDLTFHHRQTV
jgi:hypothetical protein